MATEPWLQFRSLVARIEGFLVEAPAMDSDARLHRLMILLNELELCYLAIDLVEPSDVEQSDPSQTKDRISQVSAAFPEFGYYHSIRAGPVSQQELPLVSDAVDDLADILGDIDNALSAELQGTWADGAFEARLLYQAHTGWHLASLRSHLYTLRFGL
jgi:hypothetical protein